MTRPALLCIVAPLALLSLLSSVVARPVAADPGRSLTAAAPTAVVALPLPTPIIAARDQPVSRHARGWYHSALAPYAVVTRWQGSAAVWPDGRWDQFDNSGRIMEIQGDRAIAGATTARAVQELIVYLRTTRMMEAHLLGPVLVAAQRVPVFLTRYRGDWMARVAFVAAGHLWRFSLNTDGWHRDGDLRDFLATLRSFQLDAVGA